MLTPKQLNLYKFIKKYKHEHGNIQHQQQLQVLHRNLFQQPTAFAYDKQEYFGETWKQKNE